MERTVILSRNKTKKEFVVSNKTKPQNFRNLVKKALNLHSEIKFFKHQDANIHLEDLLTATSSTVTDYEIILEDDSD